MSSLTASKALEGVQGVHLVPHSPFTLEEIRHGDFHGSSQQLILQRVWQQRPACLRPIRCTLHGDRNLAETIANVITSLPFIAIGLQAPRKNLNCKIYANSLIGVGIASSLYHASRGKVKQYLRWADYTMIATTTLRLENEFVNVTFALFTCLTTARSGSRRFFPSTEECLSRALRNKNPKILMAASAFLLPVQPLMVSAVHTGMMEVAFAKRALKDPDLRMAHNVHKMSSLLGGALFIADDFFPETPFLHAAWHLAAAVGVSTCNKLLE